MPRLCHSQLVRAGSRVLLPRGSVHPSIQQLTSSNAACNVAEVIPKPVPAKEALTRRDLRITMAGTPYIDNNIVKSAREGSSALADGILGPDGLPLVVSNGSNSNGQKLAAAATAATPMQYSASPSASPGIQQQQHPSASASSSSAYPLQSTPGLAVASGSGSLPLPAPAMNGSSTSAGLLPHPTSAYAQPIPQNYSPNHMTAGPSSAHTSPQRTMEAAEDRRMDMD